MSAAPVDLLLTGVGELVTARTDVRGATGRALDDLDVVADAAVAISGERILAAGARDDIERAYGDNAREVHDVDGRLVTPGFCDAHTHLVHGGTRHDEYERKILGQPVPLGGGIQRTITATRAASAEELTARALADLDVMLAHGTTTVEAKSGYGADRDHELRCLRVAAELDHAIEVIPTYLGAHVTPAEYTEQRQAYVELVVETLAEARAWATWADVFCDPVGFSPAECEPILRRAAELGFGLRVHADQTADVGAAALAARMGAASADHLDYANREGLSAMAKAGVVGVLVPGVALHLLEQVEGCAGEAAPKTFWPTQARRIIAAGVVIAVATDYNPGTSPTRSMPMALALAARTYRLSYAACWHAATINAAHALGIADDRGSIEAGKRADLVVWDASSHGFVVERFGENLVDAVIKSGRVVVPGASEHSRR